MIENKINKLKPNLRKFRISLKICGAFFIGISLIIGYPLFAGNSQKESPVITQGWEYVFNNPQKALDICLPALDQAKNQNDSLLTAELNRLIGTAYYNMSEFPKSIEHYSKSLSYFYINNNSQKIADLYNDIALSYLELNKYSESREYMLNSLNIFSKLNKKEEISKVLTNVGLSYFYDFDYVSAVSFYLKALVIADKIQNKEAMAMQLNNLAIIYKILKNYDQALIYFKKAQQIFTKKNDLPSLASVLNNIGGIYFLQDKIDEAVKYYNQSLEIKKKIDHKAGISITLNNIGEVYENKEDFTNALNYFEQSLKIKEEINNFSGIINTTDCIGRIYYKQKDYRKAELFFLRSVELGKINNVPTKTAHHYLSEIYKINNDYEKSLFHLKKFANIQDSVFGSDKVQQINELLANYETAKKDEEITSLTESNRMKEEQIRERTIFLVILGSFFASLIILVVLLIRNSNRITKAKDELKETNRIQLKTNAKLEDTLAELRREVDIRKQTENELLNTQEKLAGSLETAKELNELKTRFISMISHEYRNPLTVIMNLTELLPFYKLEKNHDNHDKYIQMIREQVDTMVKLLNDVLIIGRKGSTQQKLNIMTMPVIELCKDVITNARFIDNEKHNFVLTKTPDVDVITTDVQHLTHALANMLSNAARYSPLNSDIYIEITGNEEFIIINIRDTGIGIPDEDKHLIFEPFHRGTNIGSIPGNGLGLSIVKMYMDLLGGKIEFESQENSGTTFTLTLPKVINR
ncbi:MAG: tetratricopeptide repeat-containing sensor histidine kinase [bacterium]